MLENTPNLPHELSMHMLSRLLIIYLQTQWF